MVHCKFKRDVYVQVLEMLSLFWGFRLTIWNVNNPNFSKIGVGVARFRLTIWNVNKLLAHTSANFPITFQINYMECKYENHPKQQVVYKGFRLTIWNVNNV